MTIHLQQLTAMLPLLIVILTAVIVILSISYNRNHFFVFLLTILGFISALFSIYFVIAISPINITMLFHIDGSSILYIFMIIISSISTCIFAYPWLLKYPFNKEEFYLLILISSLGSISLILSRHMSSFFISMEIMSLPMLGLIFYSHYQKYSLEAALKYMILSGIASSFLLLGIAWIYSVSGNLNFILIKEFFNASSLNEKLVMLIGTTMIIFPLLFKLSIVPFHLWTPDIYQGAPLSVLSFFSTAGKISVFSTLLNFLLYTPGLNNKILYSILSLVSVLSMFCGNLMALFQNDLKRFFGYSSISQLGYLLIVFLSLENDHLFSLETSKIYLFSYLFSNIAFFGIVNLIANENDKNRSYSISSYQGLFWSQPMLSGLLTLVFLSLSGIPATLGFIGKFYILMIIIKEKLWAVGVSFLISTILGLFCYLRIIVNLYLNPLESKINLNVPNHLLYSASGIVIFISGMMLLIFGLYPEPLINLIRLSESF